MARLPACSPNDRPAGGGAEMNRKHLKRKLAFLVAVAVMTAVSLGYAAWTNSGGSGSAYSKATTVGALTTVDVSASTAATLYPGATGDALIKISNPNPYAVTVTA